MRPIGLNTEAYIDERVRQTFGRHPLVMGFTFDKELGGACVDIVPCVDSDWSESVYTEITRELCALVDDLGEDAAQALSGRTFARALH